MKRRFLKHNPKTVALVGMGPSVGAMFNECLTQEFQPDWADEVWAINMASNLVWHDVVIWMDDLDDQEKFKPGLFSNLRRRGKPVITSKAYPEILPESYDWPVDECASLSMQIFNKPYFNNGVAMAIAYARVKNVKTLKLYGCDFTYPDRNYAEAGRGCTEAWIGAILQENVMDIVLPQKTSLLDAVEGNKGIYGYKEQPEIHLLNGQVINPDGTIHVVDKTPDAYADEAAHADEYVAEDSSTRKPKKKVKKSNVVRRNVPGANGHAAAVAGAANA